MPIPIKQAEGFAIANGLKQVIIFGHDGKETHVLTWGDTVEHAAQAAAGANAIKKKWGWPDDLQAESAKVSALKADLEAALARIKELEQSQPKPTVHVIEGTEYERGWGQRPDGFVAFLTKEAAETWIAEYNAKYNNEKSAPDEYTVYRYVGIRDCSHAVRIEVVQKGLKHLHRSSELLA